MGVKVTVCLGCQKTLGMGHLTKGFWTCGSPPCPKSVGITLNTQRYRFTVLGEVSVKTWYIYIFNKKRIASEIDFACSYFSPETLCWIALSLFPGLFCSLFWRQQGTLNKAITCCWFLKKNILAGVENGSFPTLIPFRFISVISYPGLAHLPSKAGGNKLFHS